jgi:hypothetical protein
MSQGWCRCGKEKKRCSGRKSNPSQPVYSLVNILSDLLQLTLPQSNIFYDIQLFKTILLNVNDVGTKEI